jgi:hypothetical protein
MSALKQLVHAITGFSRAFDQQIAEVPLLGQLFSPKWNIIQGNLNDGFALLSENRLQSIPQQISPKDIKGPNCLRLSTKDGQIRNLQLPAAAAPDPVSAVSLTLDTLSPIAPEDTAFAIQSTTKTTKNSDFSVSIALSSKTRIKQFLDKANEAGLRLSAIDICNPLQPLVNPEINLITGKNADTGFSPTQVWGVSCAGLLIIALALNLWTTTKLEPQLEQYQALNQPAGLSSAMAQQVDWQKRISVSRVWNAVTLALLDSAWAQSMVIDKDQLRLSGKAINAAALVNALESSPVISQVRLAAASVQEDDGSESFDLQAKISAKDNPS